MMMTIEIVNPCRVKNPEIKKIVDEKKTSFLWWPQVLIFPAKKREKSIFSRVSKDESIYCTLSSFFRRKERGNCSSKIRPVKRGKASFFLEKKGERVCVRETVFRERYFPPPPPPSSSQSHARLLLLLEGEKNHLLTSFSRKMKIHPFPPSRRRHALIRREIPRNHSPSTPPPQKKKKTKESHHFLSPRKMEQNTPNRNSPSSVGQTFVKGRSIPFPFPTKEREGGGISFSNSNFRTSTFSFPH